MRAPLRAADKVAAMLSSKSLIYLLIAAFALAACGGEDAVTAGSAAAADAGASNDGATLKDGWQFSQDSAPPDDSWAWNGEIGRWRGGDAAFGDGGQNLDVVSDSTVADVAGAEIIGGSDAAVAEISNDDTAGSGKGKLGAGCGSNAQCDSGFCLGAQGGNGYCSLAGCGSSTQCNSAEGLMCCVPYPGVGGVQTYCIKEPLAKVCGTGSKSVGDSCIDGGQSDCNTAKGNFCFKQGKQAVCLQGCQGAGPNCPIGTYCYDKGNGGGCLPYTVGVVDGSPCAGKNIGGCGKGAFCIETFPGDLKAYCASTCSSDGDCANGLGCTIYAPGQGICQKYGSKGAGSSCADDRFSCAKGLFCIGDGQSSAICTQPCSLDTQCSGVAGITGAAFCLKSPGQPGGVCYPKGDKANGEDCSKNPFVCAKGSYCTGSYDVYSPDAICQKGCGAQSDGTCPPGSKCIQYNENYSGCQVDGAIDSGQSCAGKPNGCKAGSFCLGEAKQEICLPQCTVGVASGPGSCPVNGGPFWCSPYGAGKFGVCMLSGSGKVGDSCVDKSWACQAGTYCQQYGATKDATCIAQCGDNGSCPNGADCKDFGQAGKFCTPTGKLGQGADCTANANSCAAGHVCISKQSPYAMCAKQCAVDSECGDGHWCGVGKWGGYCLKNGPLPKDSLCFGKPWDCTKGTICLGDAATNQGAFCGKECSGFASACTDGQKCQYYGGGQSWCVKTGTTKAGSPCSTAPLSCEPSSLCIQGTPQALCLQQCGVGKPSCPADSPCKYFKGSALAYCVPAGFYPFGQLNIPF